MFKEARVKLTVYYLAIIMAISIFFSFIVYKQNTIDLDRIERFQRFRSPILDEIRGRIITRLFYLNVVILGISGWAGYYLAGKTLTPIKCMVDDQDDFIGNASHELRTPLTSLKTEIEVALRDKNMTLKEAKTLLESNLEDVNKMTLLSNYLLKLNRFQSGTVNLEFKKVNLAEIVRKAIGKEKIKTDLNDSYIVADEDLIFELALILIDNAKKYSKDKKDITLTVKNKILTVSDRGVGISKEDLPHIFDRFYRGNKARGKDGYGLGLSIAKQIVEAHKAKIKVESKVGVGSAFKVIFS